MDRDSVPGTDDPPPAPAAACAGMAPEANAGDAGAAPGKTETDPKVIVCAVGASNGAPRVLSMGAKLARAFPGAALHVLQVSRRSHRSRAHAAASSITAHAKDHLDFHVTSARAQCRNTVTGHFQIGDPTTEVLRLVSKLRAQLLIVGTRDHAGFETLLLGSSAETQARASGCSVLVVRPERSR
jgi:nucleotide-binding universal stress UspA family protein